MPFTRTLAVRWSDLDPNAHVRSSVYWDFATQTRIGFLEESGYPTLRFVELAFGPVVLRESAEYHREIRAGDVVTVDVRVGGLSPDGDHWRMVHGLYRADGVRAATLRVQGGWLDLGRRRLRKPPEDLQALMDMVERTEDFEPLALLVR